MSKSHGDNRSPAQAQFAQALALHRAGNLDAAEHAYRAILKSQRRHFDAAHLLGLLLLGRGEAAAAEAQIAQALKFAGDARNANVAEAHNNRGLAQVALRRFADALASFEAALAIQPGHVDAAANLAGALSELGRVEDALAACDRALALQPRQAEVHNTRGKALRDLRRFDESLAAFDRAIALKSDYHDAFYNRGLTHLLLGDFAKGWPDAEHRWHTADYAGGQALTFSATRAGLKGKRVLVLAEQGVGDEIMFASILPDLVREAAKVMLECDPRLMGLFARSFPGVMLVPRSVPPAYDKAAFDVVIPAGSLGRFYRQGATDFPALPFLTPDPQIISGWKARLAPLGDGLKIGISWRGGTDRTRRNARSIPLENWAPLLNLPDTQCISLQYGDVADEIARANRGLRRPIVNFEPAEINDFDRLAGLVSALDLVVTVQTTLVHLCGAIGKPCRVFVPYIPEWRYGTRGGGMAWYGTVALYRQAVPGQWDETMARVISDLKDESAMPADPIRIFIGYDPRVEVTYHVLAASIARRASHPVAITPIALNHLKAFYDRPRDAKQSTEFSFTRFLTPYLAGFEGWAVYMDCDMVMLDDIANLWRLRDEAYALMCVQHDHMPREDVKFLGERQLPYAKKNWSSMMLMNCGACTALTPDYVAKAAGLELHQFKWTQDARIGALPARWNHLVDHDPARDVSEVSLLHYTIGGPWLADFQDCGYADVWRKEQAQANFSIER